MLKSRKFWIAVVDAFAGLLGLYAAAFLVPERAELIVATWGFLQIPVGVWINAIAKEDAAALAAGVHRKQMPWVEE